MLFDDYDYSEYHFGDGIMLKAFTWSPLLMHVLE